MAEEFEETPSRNEYIQHVHNEQYKQEFGTYTALVRAAGLEPKSRAQKSALERAQDKYENSTGLYIQKFQEEILPFCGKYQNKPTDCVSILVSGDMHSIFMDPFCLHVLLATNKRRKPDIIFLNGDIVDWPEISDHDQNPDRICRMQGEIDYIIKKILEPLRADNPKADIYWQWGNHEARLFRYLCKNPGMASLRCLKFGNLFDLERLRISLVAKQNFVSQTKKKARDIARPYMIFGDYALAIAHGTKLSMWHTGGEAKTFGHSISLITGHTHRPQYLTMTKLRARYFGLALGTMARIAQGECHGEDFMPDPIIDWGQSFAMVDIYKNEALPDHIIIGEHYTLACGVYYKR